ncbi:MAG: serpin family protein, partial [Thermococcus sp.]
NLFALALYSQLAKGNGNLFLSPYSIHTALAMAYEGARGQTAEEMAKVLHLPESRVVRLAGFRKLITDLNPKEGPYELKTANALWVLEGYSIRKDYIGAVRKYYLGEVRSVDFMRDPEGAASAINGWVSEQTNGKIRDIVSPMALRDARLVITNAIYFKGEWVHKFDPELTKNETFFTPKGTVEVPMMHTKGVFNYTENDLIQAVELPYRGGRLSMLVLLPRARDGYRGLEKCISPDYLLSLLANLSPANVSIALPKFEFRTEYKLSGVLSAMGMESAFSEEKANFSGITDAERLFISEVVHKAYIKVAENGTEAAAATGIIIVGTSMPVEEPKYIEFRADHPFIFVIVDKETKEVLFMGRLVNPEE